MTSAQDRNRSKKIVELSISDTDLITFFRTQVKEHGNENAVFFKGKFKTYNELEEEVNRLSDSLRQLGVRKGTRVAVFLPNCPQFITTFFAVQALGGIFIAFNPLYSAYELQQRLQDCTPKIFITLDLFIDKIKEIQGHIEVDHLVITSIASELPTIKKYLYKLITTGKRGFIEGSHSYDDLIKNGENTRIKRAIDPKQDIAVLQYTGGTTGSPKGAMLTHRNLLYQTAVIHYWKLRLEKQPDGQDHVAGVLPYSHIFGLTSTFLWSISEGATQYLIPDPRKFEEIMQLIHSHKIHFLFCVPVFFQKFALHKNLGAYNLSSLHLCISGGESLPEETVTVFEKNTGCLLIEGYGLSEASPVTHVNPPNHAHRKIGSIGVAVPLTEAKIMNTETEQEITKPLVPGELWVKGPGVMKGYWRHNDATSEVIRDGWLRTGDIGTVDEHGYFSIVDRLKDMIIVSGFKVWPNEVEEILLTHPSILEAAVIGFKTELGTKIKAILVKKDDAEPLSLDEVRKFCKNFLATYKVPKLVEYREELPRSPVGKILRRELRADAT
jgi:long-chain acyl-CoA synthetase